MRRCFALFPVASGDSSSLFLANLFLDLTLLVVLLAVPGILLYFYFEFIPFNIINN